MPTSMSASTWDIRREGRAWKGEEARQRFDLSPEKLEMIDGRILWDEDERVKLLGLLLENVGADRAVRLGDPAVWRAAVEQLSRAGGTAT
jgi:hypothetical protein